MNHVLVVDDDAGMRRALEARFLGRGWRVETAGSAGEAIEKFRRGRHALIVTDIRMPAAGPSPSSEPPARDEDGFAVLRAARSLSRRTAVILLTAYASVPDAVTAMKDGACDYLVKPVAFEQLERCAARVLAAAAESARVGKDALEHAENEKDEKTEKEIRGQSPPWRRALERARRAAASDADVLLIAESGTGKELVARLIHRLSPRRSRPFVAVNCAAFPETLLESELFGHARGAFTGAATTKPGKFELADGGTLLLDEVGEMPLGLQPKLLRALQEREFDRLGDTRSVRVDLRVVATTNRDLAAMVASGAFRSDLYYRLNVIPLRLPPLRERPGDVRELAAHFLARYAPAGKSFRLSAELLARLEAHPWPGNVRELDNCIRRIVALAPEALSREPASVESPLCPGRGAALDLPVIDFPVIDSAIVASGVIASEVVASDVIATDIYELGPAALAGLDGMPSVAGFGSAEGWLRPGVSLGEMEKKLFEMTLAATGGNRSRAAAMLGVSLRTVRNKVRSYGLPSSTSYAPRRGSES